MHYLKLFENYFAKLFNLIDKYHYEVITKEEFAKANSKFSKNKTNWNKKEIGILKEIIALSKCKLSRESESNLTMADINREAFLLDNNRKLSFEYEVKWTYNFYGSTVIVSNKFEIAKHLHKYYYISLVYNSQVHTNGNIHSVENTEELYKCDEFEGFLKCMKMLIQRVTNLEE